jgi:hypothetical protein
MDALTARLASARVNRDARSSDFAVFLSTPLMGAISGACVCECRELGRAQAEQLFEL